MNFYVFRYVACKVKENAIIITELHFFFAFFFHFLLLFKINTKKLSILIRSCTSDNFWSLPLYIQDNYTDSNKFCPFKTFLYLDEDKSFTLYVYDKNKISDNTFDIAVIFKTLWRLKTCSNFTRVLLYSFKMNDIQ